MHITNEIRQFQFDYYNNLKNNKKYKQFQEIKFSKDNMVYYFRSRLWLYLF